MSYGNLQMRAYITETIAEKVQAKLVEHGKAWASKFSEKASVEQAESGKWRRATLSYDMSYGDYGAKAIVDVLSPRVVETALGASASLVIARRGLEVGGTSPPLPRARYAEGQPKLR